MDLMYSVSADSREDIVQFKDDRALCVSVSCRNMVVFTSTENLSSLKQSKNSTYQSEHFVYVCDLDKPWHTYKVTSYDEEVIQLVWHVGGSFLALATSSGIVQVWAMKEYLVNRWQCICSTTLNMEEVVSLEWLHTTSQLTFNVDKKDTSLYNEKFVPTKFAPSLSHFGGRASDGWIAVTASGLVCVGIININMVDTVAAIEPLCLPRQHVSQADIAFSPTGEAIVAISDGLVTSSIQCFKITLHIEHDTCKITSKPHAGFSSKCSVDPNFRENQHSRVRNVRFAFKEDPNSLIIACDNGTETCLELWTMQDQTVGLHRIFQQTTVSDIKPFILQKWLHKVSTSHQSILTDITQSKLPVVQNIPENNLLPLHCVALSFRDGSIKMVHRHTLQTLSTLNLKLSALDIGQGEKKRKLSSPYMASLHQTVTGCSLVGVDCTGALNLIRVVNAKDISTATSYVLPLLEYTMYAGCDWWDILLSLKPSVIDNFIVRLSENFNKQPSSLQNVLVTRYLAMKASLYNMLGSSQPKASDTQSKLLLTCVTATFKSILTPGIVGSQDMSPGEKLSITCNRTADWDMKNVLLSLEARNEFLVDASTVQSLQQLIQWVADFTLYLLASVPLYQRYTNIPGASIARDVQCLSMLRELLVIIRIWGMKNPSCLPTFTTSTPNQDSVSVLFKLITKLWLSVRDNNTADFDEMLIDECCLLPSQVSIPSPDQCLIIGSSQFVSLSNQHQPVKTKFGAPPEFAAKPSVMHHLPEGTTLSNQKRDALRQINMGKTPVQDMKRCTRCDRLSLVKSPISTPVSQMWDQRWVKLCMCGGQWIAASSEEVET